jgi:hypothetical protein
VKIKAVLSDTVKVSSGLAVQEMFARVYASIFTDIAGMKTKVSGRWL